MTIVTHPDPWALEAELLDRIARAKASDPLARVLVVVPTNRLADHVQRRVAARLGAAIGIDVFTHRALARTILARSGRLLRVADVSIEDVLLARVLDRASNGPLLDFVRERPVARPALAGTLADLRDAGVDPAALPASEIGGLYGRWTRAWDELAGCGIGDEAGLAQAAAPLAAPFAARYAAVYHHGAYELIGVHEDLVRALDAGRQGVLLKPAIEEGEFPDLRAKEVRLADAQGARAELLHAVSIVLARIAEGAPPHEQAVIVRTFGPYASAVEALLLDSGVRWHTSFASSLRREPAVSQALVRVAAAQDRPAARWSSHADTLAALAAGVEADAAARLAAICEAMRSIELDLGETREVSPAEADAFFTARVDAATLAPLGHDGGGPRLLDAMQARGVTFDHVVLAGMNAGVWPRVPREDPFLPDDARRRLRAASGRPVPVRLDNDGEERLLLAMTLGAAKRSIDVSWRRADDHGRPVVRSLAVRDIERAAGAPAPRSLPAHPRSRLEALARDPAVLRAEDELVLAALAADTGADAAAAVRARRPELAAGVAWVGATDAFDPRDLRYDGRVGAPRNPRALSVSKLETLARCPLQFFFEHRLEIEPADRVDSPYDPSRQKLGLLVHDVLKETYERLAAEGRFGEPGLPARIERARELLRQAWAARAEEFAAARARPLPVVDRVESDLWRRALDGFLAGDLSRMDAEGQRILEVEVQRSTKSLHELPPLAARLDRIVEGPAGRVVGDYKTGGKLDGKVKATAMLKGQHLQVAVYALLEGTPVELLGVGRDQDVRWARFEGFPTAALRDGIVETVRTVVQLDESGTYPMNPGRHCAWCAFRSACRHGHPPSVVRGDHAADAGDYRELAEKSVKRPML